MRREPLVKDQPVWLSFRRQHPRGLPERPLWRRFRLLALPILVATLMLVWLVDGGWQSVYRYHWYTNHSPGTLYDDGALTITTDHTTYFGDEPLAITVTNHLREPIYTQITPHNPSAFLGTPCSIDLYSEVLDHGGHWVAAGYYALGVGAGCDLPCSGLPLDKPPPQVLAIAPSGSYTQHWHPSIYFPKTPPGTYRIVFRFSLDSAAAKGTYVGAPGRPGVDFPQMVEVASTNSAPIHVLDDGVRLAPAHCDAA